MLTRATGSSKQLVINDFVRRKWRAKLVFSTCCSAKAAIEPIHNGSSLPARTSYSLRHPVDRLSAFAVIQSLADSVSNA